MKSADAKAPKFDSKWWVANKAKAADADGKFAKALLDYEASKKALAAKVNSRNGASSAETADVVTKLTAVKTLAAKKRTDSALGLLQKETKEGLASYEKLSDAAIKQSQAVLKDPVLSMTVGQLVKSAPQFQDYCKKTAVDENYNFLSLMAKNPKFELRWYDAFIKHGAKFQVNLPDKLRVPFDKIAADVKAGTKPDTPATWAAAPWQDATKNIAAMMTADSLPRFRAAAAAQLLLAKLP